MKKLLNLKNFPEELKALPQWVVRKQKVPFNANNMKCASTTDSSTWSDFQTAVNACEKYNTDGLGFVFAEGQDYVGIDVDTCFDPSTGEISEGGLKIIEMFDSYTELSPSGYGVHIFIKADPNFKLPFHKHSMKPNGIERYENKNGVRMKKEPEIELYNCGRYFTVTGNIFGEIKPLSERTEALKKFYSMYHDRKKIEPRSVSIPTHDLSLDDDEVLERAMNSSNGLQFRELYYGNISGYASHSNADQALCSFLAFWCQGDKCQMDRIFRSSALMRSKWDEMRGHETYGAFTIDNAVRTSRNFYDPAKYTKKYYKQYKENKNA